MPGHSPDGLRELPPDNSEIVFNLTDGVEVSIRNPQTGLVEGGWKISVYQNFLEPSEPKVLLESADKTSSAIILSSVEEIGRLNDLASHDQDDLLTIRSPEAGNKEEKYRVLGVPNLTLDSVRTVFVEKDNSRLPVTVESLSELNNLSELQKSPENLREYRGWKIYQAVVEKTAAQNNSNFLYHIRKFLNEGVVLTKFDSSTREFEADLKVAWNEFEADFKPV